jgi:hypothetical protein
MAGRGPTPKSTGQLVGAPTEAPPLPDAETYSERTRAWYATWATSPQAANFAATDWQRLAMLAPLVDAYFAKPERNTLAEIRINESKLGATPEDRLRLAWRLDAPAPPPPEPGKPLRSRDRPDPRKRPLT